VFPPDSCICDAIPRLETPFRFILYRHASERERLTNTARWAALAIPGTEIVEHGLPGEPADLGPLTPPGSVVLFPSARPQPPPATTPPVVVVPDGTWGQARRMLQRVPALRALPRLSLPAPAAALRLRRPHRGDGMSTLEAMAGALQVLGEPEAAARLLRLHRLAVERVLRLKGMWDPALAEAPQAGALGFDPARPHRRAAGG
jgi:DTW domain-containing protein YfiP